MLLFVSCKVSQPKGTTNTSIKTHDTESQMAFFFLEALKNKNDRIEIKLDQQKIVYGKLKEYFYDKIPEEKIRNATWLVSFIDNLGESIIQLQMANPLIEELEYADEEGHLKKKTIYHNKKDFVLRVPYHNSIKSISFEEYRAENQNKIPYFIDQIILK